MEGRHRAEVDPGHLLVTPGADGHDDHPLADERVDGLGALERHGADLHERGCEEVSARSAADDAPAACAGRCCPSLHEGVTVRHGRSRRPSVHPNASPPDGRRPPAVSGSPHRSDGRSAGRSASGAEAMPQPPPPGVSIRSDVAGVERGRCTCRAGARPAPRRRRAAASSRPPRPGSPPARPHGARRPALGDERQRCRLEHLEVALDAVAARRARRRRRSPAAAAAAAPASGTPARAPRSACSWCWSWRCGRRSCPAPVGPAALPAGRSSRSTPSRSPPMSTLFIVPCDAAPTRPGTRLRPARRGRRRRRAG